MLRICDISWTVSVMTLVCDWSARLPRHHYTGSVFGDKRRAAPSFSDFDQSDRLEVIISANQRFVPRVFESWSGWRWSGMTQSSRRSWAALDPGWPWWSSPWAGEWVSVCEASCSRTQQNREHIHTHVHTPSRGTRVRARSEQHKQTRHSDTRLNGGQEQNQHRHDLAKHTHTHTLGSGTQLKELTLFCCAVVSRTLLTQHIYLKSLWDFKFNKNNLTTHSHVV